jgi:hypothetical protein
MGFFLNTYGVEEWRFELIVGLILYFELVVKT